MDPVQRLLQLCQAVYNAGTSEPGNWASMQKPLVRMALEIMEEVAQTQLDGAALSEGQPHE